MARMPHHRISAEFLFQKTRELAKEKKAKFGDVFDGQVFWGSIKKHFAEFDGTKLPCTYKPSVDLVELLGSNYPEYNDDGNLNLANHCIHQALVNLPTTEITIRKLIQIGLNVGQFEGLILGDLISLADYREVAAQMASVRDIGCFVTEGSLNDLDSKLDADALDDVLRELNGFE